MDLLLLVFIFPLVQSMLDVLIAMPKFLASLGAACALIRSLPVPLFPYQESACGIFTGQHSCWGLGGIVIAR